ncbi:protein ECT2 isoform X3 [Atheta coriaria]
MGFPEEEEKHMVEILESNGGTITTMDDATCTHVVVDQSERYPLEANDSLTPSKVLSPSPIRPCPSINPSDCFRTPKLNALNTLHEHAMDTSIDSSILNTTEDMQNLDLDTTGVGVQSIGRKRKLPSPDSLSFCSKRKRDLSYSENTRKKISSFFKTPLGYLSNRRRTIGGAQNQSLNESVISSSGVFDVETVENLSACNRASVTPTVKAKKPRKNLFLRTFSTSKFIRPKSNVNDSFTSECSDAVEKFNSSCFPDFSSASSSARFHELRSNFGQDQQRVITQSAVVDESKVTDRPDGPGKAHMVKAEWFWTSVQKEFILEEKEYLYEDYLEKVLSPNTRRDSHQATPSSASRRKRKRLHETLSSLAQQQSPACVVHHKRRSSISDAGLLSVSGSFLDCTTSPDKALQDAIESPAVPDTPRKGLTARQQVFLELVQTESNYVNILHTIMNMFKKHLEDMDEEDALLNNTELKIIFGNLPPIYETHVRMLDELRWTSSHWSEDKSIGNIILKYATDLLKAYPPFVNFFEEMKEMLTQCDANKPRFHAFLKVCQTKPECGRQSLQDLLIRPVQRLPSISLLLNDILKHTPKSNADHGALDQALASIREVMTHVNEDKRKTEGQRVMFDIFNDIDNCPPDLVSSHRTFVTKCDVVQLCAEGLAGKGSPLLLFLFSDQLEICKKRSKGFQTLKSPNALNGGHHKNSASKPYKHVRLMSLSMIKRVIDIRETDDCQRAFGFVFRNNDELKERLFTFTVAGGEDVDKMVFLRTLCRTMATNACTADSDKFLVNLDPADLEINTSMVNNGTLSKAIKLAANRTKIRVGRAFSFNKTPSKLKRAVSSMMSPFGSSTNLTPSLQLAQMRLASYNNISELGNAENAESPPLAPLSQQPTRKFKTGSLGVNALKRL